MKAPIDLENIELKLRITLSLMEALTGTYLKQNAKNVCTSTALCALGGGDFNGGITGPAYEVIRVYDIIANCATILQERLEEIADGLTEIIEQDVRPNEAASA